MTEDQSLKPLVSVVCHTFNHEDYVAEALDGFLRQVTDFPVEIIVNDDCSNDKTRDIVDEYADRYPGRVIKIYHSVNQYSRGNRPPAFSFFKARGEFIAICEGDDYWVDPYKLQKQYDAMRCYPQVNICVHRAWGRYGDRLGKDIEFDHGEEEKVISVNEAVSSRHQFSPTASYFLRSGPARAMPEWFYRDKRLPYGDYFIEAILGGNGILYLPDVSSVYRRSALGSFTESAKKISSEALFERMKNLVEFTRKVEGLNGVELEAVQRKVWFIHFNYLVKAIQRKDVPLFLRVHESSIDSGCVLPIWLKVAAKSSFALECVFVLHRLKTNFR